MKKILLVTVLVSSLLVVGIASATSQATCPSGGGWTKVDSSDLSGYPVPGATGYCFKAGSDNSQGCTGGIFSSWPQPEGTCGLSHWSYFIPPYEVCDETTAVYDDWGNWTTDPGNSLRECHTKTGVLVDARDRQTQCGEAEPVTECRDVSSCQETTAEYGEWSEPILVEGQFCSYQEVTYLDANDGSFCGSETLSECEPSKTYCSANGLWVTIPESEETPADADPNACVPENCEDPYTWVDRCGKYVTSTCGFTRPRPDLLSWEEYQKVGPAPSCFVTPTPDQGESTGSSPSTFPLVWLLVPGAVAILASLAYVLRRRVPVTREEG